MSDKAPTKKEVQTWVKDKILVPGDPPCRVFASYWRKGAMRYLFFAENNVLLEDWYYCEHCTWTIRLVKGKGTAAIKNHWAKHEEVKFEITKSELASLLAQASKHANVPETTFQQNMFTLEEWNSRKLDEFWRKIGQSKTVKVEAASGRSTRAMAKSALKPAKSEMEKSIEMARAKVKQSKTKADTDTKEPQNPQTGTKIDRKPPKRRQKEDAALPKKKIRSDSDEISDEMKEIFGDNFENQSHTSDTSTTDENYDTETPMAKQTLDAAAQTRKGEKVSAQETPVAKQTLDAAAQTRKGEKVSAQETPVAKQTLDDAAQMPIDKNVPAQETPVAKQTLDAIAQPGFEEYVQSVAKNMMKEFMDNILLRFPTETPVAKQTLDAAAQTRKDEKVTAQVTPVVKQTLDDAAQMPIGENVSAQVTPVVKQTLDAAAQTPTDEKVPVQASKTQKPETFV